jgi:Domain of unknown function (DUF4157)
MSRRLAHGPAFDQRPEASRQAAREPHRGRPAKPTGAGTPRFLQRRALQLDTQHSPLEREADAVAEQIMRMPDGAAPARIAGAAAAPSHAPEADHPAEAPPVVHEALSTAGQPLDPGTRRFMEPRFGHDFSQVRLHTDAKAAESAQAVNARAYTAGNDVVLGAGEYAPQSMEGRRLLAHELSHVVQKQGASSAAHVHRKESGATLQRSPDRKSGRDPRALGEALEKRVNTVALGARASRSAIATALRDGLQGVDATRVSLEAVAEVYTRAYERFELTLKRGQAEARAKEAMKAWVLGVAIGVAVGVPLGAALSGLAVVRTLDMALMEFGKTLVKEGAKKTVLAPGSGPAGPTAQQATEAFTAKANPTLKRLETFQRLSDLYRELATLGLTIDKSAQVSEWCVDAKADARELATSGRHRTLSVLQLDMQVAILEQAAESQVGLGDQLAIISGRIRDAQTEAAAASARADAKRMERQLWIHWMASLPPGDADLLGADAISNRLSELGVEGYRPHGGARSLIGWYPGDWLSDDDQDEGVKRATIYSAALAAVGQIGVLQEPEVRGGAPVVEQDVRGNVLAVRTYAKTFGRLVLGGTPGDPRTPWARADGLRIEIQGVAAAGDAIRIVGVLGGYDVPRLVGQRREDEARGLPAPDLSKDFNAM